MPARKVSDKYLKTIEYKVEPERWLKSGALVLAVHDEWTTNGGDFPECSETVTIAFDANHTASGSKCNEGKVSLACIRNRVLYCNVEVRDCSVAEYTVELVQSK